MKRIYFLITLILSINCFVNAQDECAISLQEAQNAFNNKNYQLTKILCSYITANCGNDYGNVQEMLQVIEEENKPTMTLSSKDIFVNGNEGDTAITVYCNKEWTVALNVSEMFYSISKKDSIIKIKYEENEGETIRHNYFDIQTTDGSISERVNIYQFTKPKKQETKGVKPYLFIDKSKIYCSAHSDTNYINVTTNFPWDIQNENLTSFSIIKEENRLMIISKENNSINSHTDYVFVRTIDNSIIKKITLVQSGNTEFSDYSQKNTTNTSIMTNTQPTPNTQTTQFKTDRTSIYCTYTESTEIVNVSSNTPWEIINVQSSFFTTQKNNNSIIININNNPTNYSRTGTITIQTIDGREHHTITITQTGLPAKVDYEDSNEKEKKKKEWPKTFIHIII